MWRKYLSWLVIVILILLSLFGIVSLVKSKGENKQMTFIFYHDVRDDMVPFLAGEKSTELLTEKGFQAKMNVIGKYRGSPHFTTVNNLTDFLPKELDKLLKN